MTRNPMLRKLRAVLLVLVLGATGWFVTRFGRRGGPAPGTGPDAVWLVDDLVRIRGDAAAQTSNGAWDGHTLKLFAMRNEVVAWQVALRPSQSQPAVTVELDGLVSGDGKVISPKHVERFREHYLEVTAASQYSGEEPVPDSLGRGTYPCQLVPLAAGATVDAPGGQVSSVWFDVTVPEDAVPGSYQGRLTVSGGTLQAAFDVVLEVLPLTMPRETHFRNWFYYGPEQLAEFYHAADEATVIAIEAKYQALAHRHRMSLATEAALDNGNFRWGAWWARFGPYLSGSAFKDGPCRQVGANAWPIAVSRHVGQEDFTAAAQSIVRFFTDRKLLHRVFYFAWDEPADAEAYEEIRRLGRWLDAAVGDKLPMMVTEQVSPQEPGFGSLLGAVDIFCSSKTSDPEMAMLRQRGKQVWVYNGGLGGAPYVDTPAAAVAAWGPAAWRFKLDGWFMWDATYWRQKHYDVKQATDLYANPLTFDETLRVKDGKPYPAEWALRLNGDGVFVYPGEPVGVTGPVACVRMKAFRRGAQDYEYLWLLKQKGHGKLADTLSAKLSLGRQKYEVNPDVWRQVRRQIADTLVGDKQ